MKTAVGAAHHVFLGAAVTRPARTPAGTTLVRPDHPVDDHEGNQQQEIFQ
jgi:hypothetical protein